MISEEVVKVTVDTILKGDSSYCECRRSPFDGHTYNPPCETLVKVTEQVRLTLEIAAAHLAKAAEAEIELPHGMKQAEKSQWGVFGVSSPVEAEPIIPARFSTRDSAQDYINRHFPSPQFLEPRGRNVTGWSA